VIGAWERRTTTRKNDHDATNMWCPNHQLMEGPIESSVDNYTRASRAACAAVDQNVRNDAHRGRSQCKLGMRRTRRSRAFGLRIASRANSRAGRKPRVFVAPRDRRDLSNHAPRDSASVICSAARITRLKTHHESPHHRVRKTVRLIFSQQTTGPPRLRCSHYGSVIRKPIIVLQVLL